MLILRFLATPQRLNLLQRRLRQHAGSAPAASSHTHLVFDTPRAHLRREGLALHLERNAGRWVQHLRCLRSGRAWRADYAGAPEFAHVDDPALRQKLDKPKRRARIERVFELKFRRKAWLSPEGLSLILETGAVVRADVSRPFARLCIAGPDSEAARALALRLGESLCLLPEDEDPLVLGYALLAGQGRAPVRASAPDLTEDAGIEEAFGHLARHCLSHWMANRDGAIETPDNPEYVHQLRVAIRRLRAAVQIFRTVLPEDAVAAIVPPMRELMASLGRTRDLDVLMEEIVRPVVAAIPDEPRLQALHARLNDRLGQARREAGAALERPGLGRDLLTLLAALDDLDDRAMAGALGANAREDGALSLRAFVDRRLRKRLKAVQRCAAQARSDDPVSLHELRIAIKRLRYGLEFFSSLLPGNTSRKVLRKLADLQEDLGQLNDLASAGTLLMASAGEDSALREAVTLIAGWHGARYAELLADIPRHLDTVARLRLPRLAPKVKATARVPAAELPPTLD